MLVAIALSLLSAAPIATAPAFATVVGGPAPHQAPQPTVETLSLPSAPVPETYTVVAGDTLSAIGSKLSRTWEQLADFNALPDPNLILVGQVVKIPPATYSGNPVVVRPVIARSAPTVTPVKHVTVSPPSSGGSCYGLDMSDPNVRTVVGAEDSTCNPYAKNPRSGACGLGQLIGGCDTYNGYAQAQEMTSYVKSRYGSWAAAAAHERAYGWY